ncbi:Crp/Fnr family transcriptional regulator [Paraglaciecola sp. 20A4]|uniref:helix-turn-helix domain-containing protein n=1 Tax=Paraglaciecola sp. 20A4 TaxID=2687288 RepID=UPI00140DDC9F
MTDLTSHFQTSWIEKLPDYIRSNVREHMTLIRLAKRQALYTEGMRLPGIYEICSGRIKLTAYSYGGKEMTLTICGSPVTIGDTSVITHSDSVFGATCVEKSEVALLSIIDFNRLRNKYPLINELILKNICYKQAAMFRVLRDTTFLNIELRLASRLRNLSYAVGKPFGDGAYDLPVNQNELANMLGVSRQTINELLKAWEMRGLIEIVYGGVIVKKIDELVAGAGAVCW